MKTFLFSLRDYIPELVLSCLIILAFGLYIFLYVQDRGGERIIFSSPDETAVKIFSEHFAKEGNFFFPRGDRELPDFVHPRSSLVQFGHLVPVGFLGQFILYGLLYRMSHIPLYFLTPIFTILASLAIFSLLRLRYTRLQSVLGASLFLFHPAVVYYTVRGLLPNMLFVNLLIFAAYFLFRFVLDRRQTFLLCGVFLTGLALSIRPIEAGWVMSLLAFFFLWKRKLFNWKLFVVSVFYFSLALIPLIYYNIDTYGGIIQTGYAPQNGEIIPTEFASLEKKNFFILPVLFIVPFGFKFSEILSNIWNYVLFFFYPFTILALIGMLSLKKNILIFIFLFVSVWLFLLYGSWNISDNISGEVSIGVSYIRYWLPIFVLSIPLVLEGFLYLSKQKLSFLWKLGFLGIVLFSISKVFIAGAEAFFYGRENWNIYERVLTEVRQEVPKDAIIISERSDKIFFPEYEVIDVSVDAENIWKRLSEVPASRPLYYFSIYPPESIAALNQRFLYKDGLRFDFIKQIQKDYYFYKLLQ